MPSLNKMNQVNGKKAMPHAGNLLKKVLNEKRISNAALARAINIHPVGLGRYLKQPTLHAALLWKIGLVLNYNFFELLSNEFPVKEAGISGKEAQLQQEINDLKKEVELYKKVLKL
jgi:hypothetical protein